MHHIRQVDQDSSLFWLNLWPNLDNLFRGRFGQDDEHTGEARMLLKIAILEETVEEGPPPSPDRNLNEDFEQMKHDLGNKMQQELSASPVKPKKEVKKPAPKHMHKTLEELQDMWDLAHEENMKADDDFWLVKNEKKSLLNEIAEVRAAITKIEYEKSAKEIENKNLAW